MVDNDDVVPTTTTTTTRPTTTTTTPGCPARPTIPARSPRLGVYTGNTPSEITTFETWLGRPVDGILGYTGDAT